MGKKADEEFVEVEVDCHCDVGEDRIQFVMRAPGISCVIRMRPASDHDLAYAFVHDIPEMVDRMIGQANKEMEKHLGRAADSAH